MTISVHLALLERSNREAASADALLAMIVAMGMMGERRRKGR